jgi:hypothetical protein
MYSFSRFLMMVSSRLNAKTATVPALEHTSTETSLAVAVGDIGRIAVSEEEQLAQAAQLNVLILRGVQTILDLLACFDMVLGGVLGSSGQLSHSSENVGSGAVGDEAESPSVRQERGSVLVLLGQSAILEPLFLRVTDRSSLLRDSRPSWFH